MKRINSFLLWKPFPVTFKIISLGFLLFLIYFGLSVHSFDKQLMKELRNTNLANLIVWSYWWPLIVVLAIFFGRIWCMVCPVELITSFFAKIGFKSKRPGWVLSGWAITVFYAVILFVGINILEIHRNPFFMAIYLITIVFVSIIVGIVFEKNTFCRYFCPVGYLLGLYSRFAFLGWRVNNQDVCSSCKDKSCIAKKYQYQLNVKSCGVDLYPAAMDDNTDCILCAGCLKTCHQYQSEQTTGRPNPGFVKMTFGSDLLKLKPLKNAEWAFLFLVSGFVIYEILSEFDLTKNILLALPALISGFLHLENKVSVSLVQSLYIFILLPAIFWFLPYLFGKLSSLKVPLKDYLYYYGLSFIPLIAAAHLGKSILKATSRIPYLNIAFDDPQGLQSAGQILSGSMIPAKLPEWGNGVITVALTVTFLVALWFSFRVIYKTSQRLFQNDKRVRWIYMIPIFYGSAFLVTILFWRWLS
jgi:hypothetical protein